MALSDEEWALVRGIFTDEPQYSGPTVPWSLHLPDTFRKEHGYSLEPLLPLLFCEGSDYEMLRHDYWATVNRILPMQSRMLLLTPGRADTSPPPASQDIAVRDHSLDGIWEIELSGPNTLLLDYARMQIDGGAISDQKPLFRISQELMALRHPAKVRLFFEFEADITLPDGTCLCMETPEQYAIEINGRAVSEAPTGWWTDRSIQTIPVDRYLERGRNEIILSADFHCSDETSYTLANTPDLHSTLFNKLALDMELCPLYILGNFGVYSRSAYSSGERSAIFTNGPFVIGTMPTALQLGDMTLRGLYFYAGNVRLCKRIMLDSVPEKAFLRLPQKPGAVLAKVPVNGAACKTMLWAPYCCEISDHLTAGENEIVIELFGSNRNAFGAHHHVEGELIETGPSSFTDKKGWVGRHLTTDTIWMDRYYFVKFGLSGEPVLTLFETGGTIFDEIV